MPDEYVRIDGRPHRMVDNKAVPLHPSVDVEALQAAARRAPTLDDMTVPQLKQLAEQHGIDISGLTRRDDIVQAIEKAIG